jgi:hypothetical protein
MINLTIGKDIKCKIPNEWSELTITQYSKIISLIEEFKVAPPKQEQTKDQEKQLSQEQTLNNMKCNKAIFNYLTGVKPIIIDRCDLKEIENIIGIITTLLSDKIDYVMQDAQESFEFKGKTYLYPEPNMANTTFGDYIESEQVGVANSKIQANRFGAFAEQIAILCKEKGVDNTDDLIKKKTRLFGDLPMSEAWKLIFFLSKQTATLRRNSVQYLKMGTETLIGMRQKTGI